MNEPHPSAPRMPLGLGLASALAVLAVIAFHDDYGVTWDESVQATYGELALGYFRSGLRDTACNEFLDLRTYGPLFEMLPAMFYDADEPGKYDTRHLLLGLLATLLIPAIGLLGQLGPGRWLGPLAVAALVTLPRLVGDAMSNSKDIPFAVAVAWLVFVALGMTVREDFRWRRILALGAALGLTLCARPGGLLLAVALLALIFGRWWIGARRGPSGAASPARLRRLAVRLAAAGALSWGIMILPWPWAHADIFEHPVAAVREALSFESSYPVYFEGQQVSSDALPARYVAEFLLITTPPALLLLACVGLIEALRLQIVAFKQPRALWAATVAGWFLLPLVAFIVKRPNVYDGVRHFLFLLPALALLGGFGAETLVNAVRPALLRRAALVSAFALLLLPPLPALVRLHPYQYTYYNFLVGGVAGAQHRFETDYWVASYGEAMRWIDARAAEAPERTLRVLVAGSTYVAAAARHRQANVTVTTWEELDNAGLSPAAFDYYLATTRFGNHLEYPQAPIVHVVGRAGAVFSIVRDLGAASPPFQPDGG